MEYHQKCSQKIAKKAKVQKVGVFLVSITNHDDSIANNWNIVSRALVIQSGFFKCWTQWVVQFLDIQLGMGDPVMVTHLLLLGLDLALLLAVC